MAAHKHLRAKMPTGSIAALGTLWLIPTAPPSVSPVTLPHDVPSKRPTSDDLD